MFAPPRRAYSVSFLDNLSRIGVSGLYGRHRAIYSGGAQKSRRHGDISMDSEIAPNPNLIIDLTTPEVVQAFIEREGPMPDYKTTDFEPLVGSDLEVIHPLGPTGVYLTLERVEDLPNPDNQSKLAFAIVFSGPSNLKLPECTYKLISHGDAPEGAMADSLKIILHIKLFECPEGQTKCFYESVFF